MKYIHIFDIIGLSICASSIVLAPVYITEYHRRILHKKIDMLLEEHNRKNKEYIANIMRNYK